MSWFEEQLKTRRMKDNESLNEAYEAAVDAITGRSFSFDESENELALILQYYHIHPGSREDIASVSGDDDIREFCRRYGLMQRTVTLDKEWYKSAFGAYLCRFSETGDYAALLPGKFGGYYYYDRKNNRKVRLNSKSSGLLDSKAVCFYKAFPDRKLNISDMISFGFSALSYRDYALVLMMLVLATLTGILSPRLSYFLYSSVVESKSVSLLLSTVTFLIFAGISTLMINALKTLYITCMEVKVTSALRSASIMRVLSLPADFFRTYTSGELVSRIGHISSVGNRIITMLFSTSLTGIFSLAYFTQIFQYTPSLVIPSVVILLVSFGFTACSTYYQMKLTRQVMAVSAVNNGKATELVSGIQKIKMSGSEKRIFARYTESLSREARLTYNPPFIIKYNTVITTVISLAGVIWLDYTAINNGIDTAMFYGFEAAYAVVSGAFSSLASVALQIAEIKPGLEMAKPILETLPETRTEARKINNLTGNIEINNISFRYNEQDKNIIEDFSLKIDKGQYIGIVGKTGCGKSTLVRLLLGFETPQHGTIYYDGMDIRQVDKRQLRRMIGTVMQDDRLFTGDIYSNITICAPGTGMDGAWKAAEIAGIADDIREMPMGMHTYISEGSGGISGGQRQRLVIARAIAPEPRILILDEATSALDNITQKKIAEALDKLDCTRIVIAHRLSTIRNCDRILVLDKGSIIEDGTYDELIALNGYFAELVERQRLDR